MHAKNILLTLFSLTQLELAANNPLPSLEIPEVKATRAIVTPAFQNPIHPNDLSTSADPQFTIKNSGRYYFTNDLVRNHNTATGTVLLVNASNVALDFNSKAIIPSVSGSLSTGTGLAIARGRSNIHVHNGYIYSQDASGTQKLSTGINLSETALSSGSGTSYQIKLQDLHITRCQATGITGTAINDLKIENCSTNDNYNSGATTVTGLSLATINNLNINNYTSDNNNSVGSGCYGALLTDCIDGSITNLTTSSNQAGGGRTIGLKMDSSSTGCKNILLKNINSSNNSSSGNDAMGLWITSSIMIQLEGCLFNNNSTSGASHYVYAVLLENSSNNCHFTNCHANNNSTTATTSIVYGFNISSSVCYLESCQANGNTSASNAATYGFYLSSSESSILNKCTSNNNNNTTSSAFTSAHTYGFYLTSANNNQLIECQANGNMTQAAAAVTCAGFYSSASTNNHFEKCIANRNRSTSTSSAVVAAGFILAGAETRSQIIGCEASHNLVGDATSSNGSARAYGIYFNGSSPAVNCSVKNCNLHYNTVGSSGSGKAFGFYDNSTSPSTSLLIGNIAMGQGQCLSGVLDASLQWNANSEPSSSQNYFFKQAGTGDDPRQMISEVPRQNFGSISTAVVNWQNISVF